MNAVSEIIYRLRKGAYHLRWLFKSSGWLTAPKPRTAPLSNSVYAIGMVTYVARFDRFFKKVLPHLVAIFPDTQLIIAVNGYHDAEVQRDYLNRIRGFVARWPNITLVEYTQPQSLSKLWNQLIRHSTPAKTLILNDDIRISPGFREDFERCGALNENIALLNRSWSHFLIDRQTINRIGWFDERFPGVGNEDEDYECRLVLHGITVPTFRMPSLKNVVFQTVDFSYGKSPELVNTKYIRANKVYFDTKWELSDQPSEGSGWVEIVHAYAKLKEGMETPDFYA